MKSTPRPATVILGIITFLLAVVGLALAVLRFYDIGSQLASTIFSLATVVGAGITVATVLLPKNNSE